MNDDAGGQFAQEIDSCQQGRNLAVLRRRFQWPASDAIDECRQVFVSVVLANDDSKERISVLELVREVSGRVG